MKIAVFGNTTKRTILSQVEIICNFFKDKEVALLFDKQLYEFAKPLIQAGFSSAQIIEDNEFEAGLALSIGGDGTFLNTASRIGRKPIPILGINIGRLGFLADVSDREIKKALSDILDGNYRVEERALLYMETSDETELDHPYALNEIAILKQDSSSMISINTTVNGEGVHTYQADGLIIATPTGSTAYSLSVGGPIVVPQAQNFILSPVASHSLNVRPLIIPDSWEIELEISSRTGSYLTAIDGRSKVLDHKTRLKIKKADYTIKVLKQPDHTFFETLKNKLMWGVDKRN